MKDQICTNLLSPVGMWVLVSENHPVWEIGNKWLKLHKYTNGGVIVEAPYLHIGKVRVSGENIVLIAHEAEVFESNSVISPN